MKEINVFRMKIVIVGLCVICLVLFSIQIMLETEFSTKGNQRALLQQETEILDMENSILRSELYTAESYNTISSRAAQLGFSDGSQSIIYVK